MCTYIHIWIESLLKTFFSFLFFFYSGFVFVFRIEIFSVGATLCCMFIRFVISHKRTMNGIDYKVVSAASAAGIVKF